MAKKTRNKEEILLQVKKFPAQLHKEMKIKALNKGTDVKDEYKSAAEKHVKQ